MVLLLGPVCKFERLNLSAKKSYFLDKSKEILPIIIYFTLPWLAANPNPGVVWLTAYRIFPFGPTHFEAQ